ncbi:Tricarboxylate transport protein [Tolypocladium ophioglossoides CBS 100239]|uniref:Tricarboxylate transport protein n=1 Tax=Tolypocladium ophioglossoides (strain CBS 100239) TaxID=1163406 RepID=A0A0L0N5Z2_TOLOC|nr:Tricarboxylate transport protein [Tolypocladium ophioglossoides CBS 100239]
MATTAQPHVAVPLQTLAPPAQNTKKKSVSPGVSLIAGGVAGAVEASATYPFEFAKTRAQLLQRNAASTSASRNPFRVIAQVVRRDGAAAVYTGCSTLVLGTAVKAGVRFLSYDSIKKLLGDEDGRLSPAGGLLAGMAAGCVESVVAVTPTERIKTALIDDARAPGGRTYSGGAQALRSLVAQRGVRELYRGLVATTAKQAATSAVRMGSYNALKELVASRSPSGGASPGGVTTFLSGAAAGTITVYATQPFDTVKTRAQGARGQSTVEAVRSVVRDRGGGLAGLGAFWRGSTMRLGRLVVSGGVVFTVYENVVQLLS